MGQPGHLRVAARPEIALSLAWTQFFLQPGLQGGCSSYPKGPESLVPAGLAFSRDGTGGRAPGARKEGPQRPSSRPPSRTEHAPEK